MKLVTEIKEHNKKRRKVWKLHRVKIERSPVDRKTTTISKSHFVKLLLDLA